MPEVNFITKKPHTDEALGLFREGLVPHDELDVLDRSRTTSKKGFDTNLQFAVRLVESFFDNSQHDAETNSGNADRLESSLVGGFEACHHHLAKGRLQVVDDEHDILERSTITVATESDDCLEVAQLVFRRLRVELVAGDTLDCSIDTAKPHLARIDCCDEGI